MSAALLPCTDCGTSDANATPSGSTLCSVPERTRRLVVGLAIFQVVDAIANAIPRRYVEAHLDHLGVPRDLRPLLPVIKVTSALGLLVGLKMHRVGAVTSAGLLRYYAAAAGFHLLADDHPLLAAPAAACGASAAIALVKLYLPAIAPAGSRPT
jgi:DoxX-like family